MKERKTNFLLLTERLSLSLQSRTGPAQGHFPLKWPESGNTKPDQCHSRDCGVPGQLSILGSALAQGGRNLQGGLDSTWAVTGRAARPTASQHPETCASRAPRPNLNWV